MNVNFGHTSGGHHDLFSPAVGHSALWQWCSPECGGGVN